MEESGLLYQPRGNSRYPALHITYADFADDIALLSDNLSNAHALLSALESAANCTGLYLNETKTECMPINICNHIDVKTLANNILKCVDDYNYLGSHVTNSERDFNILKGIACLVRYPFLVFIFTVYLSFLFAPYFYNSYVECV